jgi:hypothetical protein
MVKFASPRVQKKKKRIKKYLVFSGVIVCITLISGLALYVTGALDAYTTTRTISPIPTFNAKGILRAGFSKTPVHEIESALQTAGIVHTGVYSASQSAYIVKQQEGQEIILTSAKDIKTQVATLQLILSKLTIEGKTLSRVDLRFDKPIVVFK